MPGDARARPKSYSARAKAGAWALELRLTGADGAVEAGAKVGAGGRRRWQWRSMRTVAILARAVLALALLTTAKLTMAMLTTRCLGYCGKVTGR